MPSSLLKHILSSPWGQTLDLSPVTPISDIGDDEGGVDLVVRGRVVRGKQRGDGERRQCGGILLGAEPLQLLQEPKSKKFGM